MQEDFLAISKAKLDSSFPKAQFNILGFRSPYRRDITAKRWGVLYYVNGDIPTKMIPIRNIPSDIQILLVEMNLEKRKWLDVPIYTPPPQWKSYFITQLKKVLENKFWKNCSVADADRLTGWVKPGDWEFSLCYLNFVKRRKLCKNSVFHSIFSRFCWFQFCRCIPLPSLSDINILRDNVPDLNISTRSVTVDTFNWSKIIFVCLGK